VWTAIDRIRNTSFSLQLTGGPKKPGFLNKSLSLAPYLGVAKFINIRYDMGHTLLYSLSQTLIFNKPTIGPEVGLLNI
jgi:hypothetical protein